MKFNETTHIISIGVLVLTVIYTLVYSGISGVLLCAAVAFIAGAFIEQLELVVAVTVLFVLLYTMVLKRYLRSFEGFEDAKKDAVKEEKFEDKPDAQAMLNNLMKGLDKTVINKNESVPAPTVKKDQVDTKQVEEVTSAVKKANEDSAPLKDKESFENNIAAQEFQSATNQLFKLGKMPSEHKEGPMLDAGGTLIKAMSSFDPETTAKMTDDTKKLLETQKSLMGMLTQMRPILADGKELLQTFSGMFGGQGGANSQFKLQ